MPFLVPLLPSLISAGGAIGAGLVNRKGARTSTENRSNTSTSEQTSTGAFDRSDVSSAVPSTQPEFAPLRDLLLNLATKRLTEGASLEPYRAAGVSQINRNAELARMGLANRLTGSGLAGSAVGEAGAQNLEDRRFSDINQFENVALPTLGRQFQSQDFADALALFGQQQPTVTTTGTSTGTTTGATKGTSESTGTGTAVGPGSVLGSGFTKAADLLAFLYGMGAIGNQKTPLPVKQPRLPVMANFAF